MIFVANPIIPSHEELRFQHMKFGGGGTTNIQSMIARNPENPFCMFTEDPLIKFSLARKKNLL